MSQPLYAVADFCLIPMGTPTTSVGEYITECQRVLESMKDDGIRYEVHGYGTNLEGSFPVVCKAIERCHEAVHKLGALRIATDIRIGTRTDKPPPTFDAAAPGSQGSSAKAEEAAAAGGGGNADDWSRGLTENQRKKESVLRRLHADEAKGSA